MMAIAALLVFFLAKQAAMAQPVCMMGANGQVNFSSIPAQGDILSETEYNPGIPGHYFNSLRMTMDIIIPGGLDGK